VNRSILIKGIEIIGVLFAAFGGFLVGIAPPQEADARFAVGISSFLALIILFIVTALSKKKYPKVWIIIGACLFVIAIGAAYYYKTSYDALTFNYPPGTHVAGTELTPKAKEYKEKNAGISNEQLLGAFGGLQNKSKVWPEASVNGARTKLITSYVVLVLALATAIFALVEGSLGGTLLISPARHKRRGHRSKTAGGSRPQGAKSTKSKSPGGGAGESSTG
jgi:hypothetical protein